jgi:hypothetical protein
LTLTTRTRWLTILALGTIVVPAFAGWNIVSSTAQTAQHSNVGLTGDLFKVRSLTNSANAKQGGPKSVRLMIQSSVGTDAASQQAQPFANAAFQHTWERTDKLVASGSVQRSWYWGPAADTGSLQEDYAEGVGGKRLVQYFDKSRMEINEPNADPNSKFYVTNGLLTVELISGKMQVGNSTYVDRYPADIPMASDADDANAPTYYSFQGVSNTPLGDHPADNKSGQAATATISRGGLVGDDQTKTTYPRVNFVYFDPSTKHNVPQAIWEFLNDSGPVYDSASGKTSNGRLSDPWFYATGLPISEPYWARVKVAGQQQDVLIQAFERRVVTYTPNGVPGFKVQMSNIGQHYYDWRYKDAGHPQGPLATPTGLPAPGTPTATPVQATPTTAALNCSDVPAAVSATINPLCGPIGTFFNIHITGFQPGEKISLWYTLPDGRVIGTDAPIDAGNHPGSLNDFFDSSQLEGAPPSEVDGLWYITYQGDSSKHQSIVYFKITPDQPEPGQTATATPTTDPNLFTCTNIPASVNMTVTPSNCAPAGTTFRFVGRGFQPGENVGAYLTAPSQAVIGARFQLTADENGVAGTVSYGTLKGDEPGIYALTMEGTTTHAKAFGYFKVTP